MAAPLLLAGVAAATTVGGLIGWKARGTASTVTTAQNTFGTFQLVLILGITYAGYRFVKGLK